MAYSDPLDQTTPLENDFVSNGDDFIRQLKRALRQRLGSFFKDVDVDPLEPKDGFLKATHIPNGLIVNDHIADGTIQPEKLAAAPEGALARKLYMSALFGWSTDNVVINSNKGLESQDSPDESTWYTPIIGIPVGSTIKKLTAFVHRQTSDDWIRFWIGYHNMAYEGTEGAAYVEVSGTIEDAGTVGFHNVESTELNIVVGENQAYIIRISAYRTPDHQSSVQAFLIDYNLAA